MAKIPKPFMKGLEKKRKRSDVQKHTATEIMPAHARGIAEGLCPTCGTTTEASKEDAIVHYTEIINKHPFTFEDVRFCPKCKKMLYIEKPKEAKPQNDQEIRH